MTEVIKFLFNFVIFLISLGAFIFIFTLPIAESLHNNWYVETITYLGQGGLSAAVSHYIMKEFTLK